MGYQCGVEALKEYDADFERNRFAIVELANEEELEVEQVILDNHPKRGTKFSDHLLQLLPEPEIVPKKSPATAVAEGLLKRNYVIHELTLRCRFDDTRTWYGHLSSTTVMKVS